MIGVIGARGAVGSRVAEILAGALGETAVVCGVRRRLGPDELHGARANLRECAVWQEVDAASLESVALFARSCTTLVDCHDDRPGSSDLVAQACARVGVRLVAMSPLGAGAVRALQEEDLPCLGGAGFVPGLSGMLQTLVCEGLDTVNELVYCAHLVGALSLSSSRAILDALFKNHTFGALRGADLVHMRTPGFRGMSDFFDPAATFFPVVDDEARLLTRTMGIRDGVWLTAFGGEEVRKAMPGLARIYLSDREAAARELVRAMEADACEMQRSSLVARAYGNRGGTAACRELDMTASDPLTCTAASVAATAAALDCEVCRVFHPSMSTMPRGDSILRHLAQSGQLQALNMREVSLGEGSGATSLLAMRPGGALSYLTQPKG